MAVNPTDIAIDKNGNARWTGGESTYYAGLEFHRFIGGLSDDEQASGDDLIDITTDHISDRSTDKIFSLPPPLNIDDTLARHLYGCSIEQDDGDTLYAGLKIVGVVENATQYMIIQDRKVLAAWWGTGVNPDPANLVLMQCLIKVREGGADIDGKRVLVLARELGDQWKEFPVTLGQADSVAAISTEADLNNESTDATIEGWSTIVNTEGFQQIDIDGDTVTEDYYTKWDMGSQSLPNTYERSKWVGQRSHIADNGTDTGSDFTVANATILGQGQEFTARGQVEKLTEARFQIKIGAGTPTGVLVAELYASTGGSPPTPTGAALATSEEVLASLITSSYKEVIFRFNDNYSLAASTDYFIVIRHAAGDASNYFQVKGLATTGTDDGSRAEDTGSWTGYANDDLWFTVKSSPVWFGMAGEIFRGITHQIPYDTQSGSFTETEDLFWGTQITYDNLVSSFQVGEYVIFTDDATSALICGGKVLKDTGSVLTVALDDISGSLLGNDDNITGLKSTATAKINVTITNDNKAGGEGVVLAWDDTNDILWIQLVSGQAPVDGLPLEGRTSGATAAVNGSVTIRTVRPEFIGQCTGLNLIGAYGVGFDTNDIGAQDKFFDLTNTPRTPPNNVVYSITGLASGEDRVLVGPGTGATPSVLQKGQWLLSTALSGGSEVAVVIKTGAEAAPIATDIPKDGTNYNTRLRIELDSGIYRRQAYTTWSGSTFTIPSTDYSGANQASVDNDVFCAFIDVLADSDIETFTAVYKGSDRNLHVRVRDGGGTPIKTFEGGGIFKNTPQSTAAVRISDA